MERNFMVKTRKGPVHYASLAVGYLLGAAWALLLLSGMTWAIVAIWHHV